MLSVMVPPTMAGSGSMAARRGDARATLGGFVVEGGGGDGDLDGNGGGRGWEDAEDGFSSGTKRNAGLGDATLDGDTAGERVVVALLLVLLLSSSICPGSSCASLLAIHYHDGDAHIRGEAKERTSEREEDRAAR